MDKRLSAIFARRSIRSYTAEPLAAADVKALLEAGMAAPSASNRRPWHFVTITGIERLRQLAAIHPYGGMLPNAGLCIAVAADRDKSPDFWVQDCSSAAENILIAASMLGLGAVWLGVHPRAERESELKRKLEIPEQFGLLCMIAVGHPAEARPARTQYDRARVHHEHW
jgi:nitroreductase